MDGFVSPKLDSKASKRRKVVEKTVFTVKIGENGGKLENDLWSWRKYGQKPIKGSPYPRGYYKCSTSKGCSAKKQVERCKTDSSKLIITYTSSHNHPGPVLDTDLTKWLKKPRTNHFDEQPQDPKEQQLPDSEEIQSEAIKAISDEYASEEHFHYLQSPLSSPQNIVTNQGDLFTGNLEKPNDRVMGFLLDEEPLFCPHITTSSTPKSEENDFFDELEELPISSAFTSFVW